VGEIIVTVGLRLATVVHGDGLQDREGLVDGFEGRDGVAVYFGLSERHGGVQRRDAVGTPPAVMRI
jgi:hypothetical protein